VQSAGPIGSPSFVAVTQRIAQIEAGLKAVQATAVAQPPASGDAGASFAHVLDAALRARPEAFGSSAARAEATVRGPGPGSVDASPGSPRAETGAPPLRSTSDDRWVSPLNGRVTSEFGMRTHPVTGVYKLHTGTDVAAAAGTSIRAASSGVVVGAEWEQGNGNTITIKHDDGVTSRYAHTSEMLVAAGDRVEVGDVVARVGSTGLATGPHLHFEVRSRGKPIDAETWLGDRGANL
jgi:murein DD-endopeptidase MepM/ murein hydrolase activator NlpD